MPKQRSNTYWAERARQNKLNVINIGENGINELKRVLKSNLDEIQKEIKAFYDKYGDNPAEQLSYKEFEQYKKDLKAKAKKYPKDKTLQRMAKQDIPKYRIDRLRQLEADLQIRLAEVTAYQETSINGTLTDVAKVSHEATKKMMQESIGLSIGAINSKQIAALISTDWSGKNWSSRLWTDREKLGKKVRQTLEKGITQGTGYRKMARELKAEMGTSFNNAFRLIRTESAFIQGDINKTTYQQAAEELGLEYYKYDAFLDSRTSEICRELDGKRFKVSEMQIGVNAPPLHPSCRSTTQIILDNDIKEPVKELTEFKDFSKFNQKAYGLASYAKENQRSKKKAIDFARSFFDKNTLNSYYSIGDLTAQQKDILGSKTNNIKFSLDSFIKNRINHPDVNFYDYKKISDIIKNPDIVIPSKSKDSSILLMKKDEKYYQAVIKTTKDKKENFLTSFRLSNEKEYSSFNKQ